MHYFPWGNPPTEILVIHYFSQFPASNTYEQFATVSQYIRQPKLEKNVFRDKQKFFS